MLKPDVVVGLGGAAGDGVASAGNTLVLSLARQGLGSYSYNSYQSVIRGGHSWLRIRFSAEKPLGVGDQAHALIALNQDTLDRHLQELEAGGVALYNGAKVTPRYEPPEGVQLCPLPVLDLAPSSKRLPVMQNTVAVGALIRLMGLEVSGLESVLETTFAKKPAVVASNIEAARAGFEYAAANFEPLPTQLEQTDQKWAQVSGNELFAMGAAFAVGGGRQDTSDPVEDVELNRGYPKGLPNGVTITCAACTTPPSAGSSRSTGTSSNNVVLHPETPLGTS